MILSGLSGHGWLPRIFGWKEKNEKKLKKPIFCSGLIQNILNIQSMCLFPTQKVSYFGGMIWCVLNIIFRNAWKQASLNQRLSRVSMSRQRLDFLSSREASRVSKNKICIALGANIVLSQGYYISYKTITKVTHGNRNIICWPTSKLNRIFH